MNLDISRFRRAKTLLIDLLGTQAAEAVCTVIALCADRPIPDARCLDDVTIALSDVATRLDRDREATTELLKLADVRLHSAFGIQMLADRDFFGPSPRPSLTADFVDVVRGISAGARQPQPSHPQPDAESETWLSFVVRAAACDAATPLLYRCAQGKADRVDEMLRVAAALSHAGLDDHVSVLDPNAADRGLALSALLLSAVLTQTPRVFIVADDVIVPPRRRDETDDTGLDVGEQPRDGHESMSTLSAAGECLLAVAAAASAVTIIPTTVNARFAPKTIDPIVGVVGPLHYDRAASIAAVKAWASWPLSDEVAGKIVTLFPNVAASRRILDAAGRIPVPEREIGFPRGPKGVAAQRNALAASLIRGIEPHVATAQRLRSGTIDEPFYRELVTCDQRDFLLDTRNGDRLRRAGVRVGLFGIAGTGKTRFAAAVANNLKCSALHVQSSNILAYKLGELEKNLRNIFREARERNAVLIFDEFDSVGSTRSEVGSASYIVSMTNAILVEFDAHPLPIGYTSASAPW